MRRASLPRRLSVAFAALLLACSGVSAWLQTRASERHEQEVIQRLSLGLAAHIAGNSALIEKRGLNQDAVHELFDKLMAVNPSVEVYLLGPDGRIEAEAAPAGHLKRTRVDVAPIRQLLAGESLPILGDDPRSDGARKVFSAAPLRVDGHDAGYVYVVLQGEEYGALSGKLGAGNVLRATLGWMGLVAALGLVAGLIAFHVITRPLRTLIAAVRRFEPAGPVSATDLGAASRKRGGPAGDIAMLEQAFNQMARRIGEQWRELTAQDQQRRELVANISHDLRTPLTSLHGYLETLLVKADVLTDAERRRYLEIALGQSRNVGRLAQELFELARLEYGVVKPETERFSLADLVQDVFQKFELAAEARQQRLIASIAADLPAVTADLGMIERVLANLLANAIRHTPARGAIEVELRHVGGEVVVQVSDTGPGIPPALREGL